MDRPRADRVRRPAGGCRVLGPSRPVILWRSSRLFFLVRRHVGLAAAIVGAATLALSPIYWNAQYWDYINGVTSTYFVAGLCFGLPLSLGYRRAASLFAAGVFFAAAVTTNVFAAVLVATYPIAYSSSNRRVVWSPGSCCWSRTGSR